MPPYFEDGTVTIYHGDCREVVPSLAVPADVVITDPPYGIDFDTDLSRFGNQWNRKWDRITEDSSAFDPAWVLGLAPACVLFGANYYSARLPEGQWIVWNKRDRVEGGGILADAELAWHNCGGRSVRVFNWFWNGAYRKGESAPAKPMPALHPAQKPVALMRWLVEEYSADGDLILDPYMGSGPLAQACHQLGRAYIGIEIEESYCEAAASRLAQGVLNFGEAA